MSMREINIAGTPGQWLERWIRSLVRISYDVLAKPCRTGENCRDSVDGWCRDRTYKATGCVSLISAPPNSKRA